MERCCLRVVVTAAADGDAVTYCRRCVMFAMNCRFSTPNSCLACRHHLGLSAVDDAADAYAYKYDADTLKAR